MANGTNGDDRATKWIRWIARGMGSVLVAMWLFAGIGSALVESAPFTLESAMMAGFITTAVLGVLIAWRRERIGATILIVCGVLFSTFAYFSAGRNKGLAMLVSGAPVLLTGILFLAIWWRSRQPSIPQNSA